MRLIRPASEDDMIAAFLGAEINSERYGHAALSPSELVCPHWLPAELPVMLGITASHRK
jgi:hypothetical protein